jgi:multiple sugar transport system substrate-binding protein
MSQNQPSKWKSGSLNFGVSRRSFLKGSAALAGAAIATPAVHAQSSVTLRFLSSETSSASVAVLKKAVEIYEAKTGVKTIIDSSPISGSSQKILSAINAGTPYDLATQGYIADILQYVQADALVPLTELVSKYDWGNKAAWKFGGENWYYPYDYNLVATYYRKDLYEEKGLKIPETRDQFLENCRALAVGSGGSIDLGGCVIPLASDSATNWASFGSLFADVPRFYDDSWNVSLDQGETGQQVAGFLDFYAEAYKIMPPGMATVSYAELMSLFVTGKAAHTAYSGRLVETLEAKNPELADKYDIFPAPGNSGKKALSYAFDGFVVFKSPQSEEAMKFLKWFIDDFYIEWLHSAWMNFQPARLDIYEDPRWNSHPMIKKHWGTMMKMKSYIEDKEMQLIAVDTTGPEIDIRPCKIFNANIMPEMLQNRVINGTASIDCVKAAADRIRSLS